MANLSFTYYWHEGIEGGGWRIIETPSPIPGLEYIPPPVGTEIYLSPGWMNDSAVPVTGYMVVQVVLPGGVQRVFFTPDYTVPAGGGIHQEITPFTLDEAGTYVMSLWVLVGGVAVDYKVVNFEVNPIGISTTLTISAPATVEPDETFTISGILYETASGLPLPNQIIDLSYNGVPLGSAQTGIDGDYLIQAFIPTSGTYTLRAAFAGTTTLGASEAARQMNTAGVSVILPLAAVALIAFVLSKK